MHGGERELTLTLQQSDGRALTFLENRATVLNRTYNGSTVDLHLRIGNRQLDQLRAMGTRVDLPEDANTTPGWGR